MVKRSQQKILSIIIPAYNVEGYIEQCLNSLKDNLGSIEAIIVDDGSSDGTLKIAKKWQKNCPGDIIVISKENGGHGSTINVGLKKATGKYVRVLDSDDWLNQATLKDYIKVLEKEDSDVVLTDYSRKIAKAEGDDFETVPYSFEGLEQKTYQMTDYLSLPSTINTIELFSIHTISVKTEVIKNGWGNGLLEKTFYEYQEWVSKVIIAANTFVHYSIDVYQYYIGRNEQSMSKDKMFKNRKQHERVIMRLVEMAKQVEGVKKDILLSRIAVIVRTHYWIYFYHPHLTKSEKKEFAEFKAKLKSEMPQTLKRINTKFKIRLFMGRKRQELYNK